ncbi:hybrid sensor histidine kinase/response regulator [Gloeocapsopsis dulcis]|uniref:histidine kinase n=1 Tax=Gloeocapsopsis dulcis AAB1 = 1H9 TaxID=1433147 RepID=A0A6N8FXD6_9CHRO|nr:hybrid sensor histidine kinase/response regulator [Gloeocapsopsis dulcis]MUL37424.1 hybrid sensor histidine kinase/response regulator [Gloeocapsopsis dulcis AAB1 = 1H9]WNN87398.1 hybrid sensor histidine kinase/response regulator [Gloeocapsopsis dulcis]
MLPESEQHFLNFDELFAQQNVETEKYEVTDTTHLNSEEKSSLLDKLSLDALDLSLPADLHLLVESNYLDVNNEVDITLPEEFDFNELFKQEDEFISSSDSEIDFNNLFSSLENNTHNNYTQEQFDLGDFWFQDSGSQNEPDLDHHLSNSLSESELDNQDTLISAKVIISKIDSTALELNLENTSGGTSSFAQNTELIATQPEIQTVSQSFSEEADFTDLEVLLDEETLDPQKIVVQATEISNEFDELETLLDTDVAQVTENINDFADLDSLLDVDVDAAATEDDFADLDTLLEEEAPQNKPVPEPIAKTASNVSRKVAFEQTMRVSVKQLDGISNLVGELVVNRNSLEQDQQRMRQFTENLLHRVQQLNELGIRMQDLYERSLLEASLLSSKSHSSSKDIPEKTPERHATGMDFDALEMDRFTGFHTLSQEMIEMIVRVRESASDIEFVTDETEQVARQFRQVTTQLQEGMTRSRMIPFSQIADRLPRAIKEITLKYGKQAELKLEGCETLIDKVILEQLYDPMTHLVNNSITHGIETLEERIAKGKSPVGTIAIRAFHQGNQTVISVADDGAGIDSDKVLTKAIQKGLITVAEARTMLPVDVYDLLFHPGFSTKDQVDEFAGRGVGMDVVRTSLQEMRGTITIDSTLDQGTTFTIRLPLTLSICKALCCLSDKARIAFPMDGVEDMMDIPTSAVLKLENGQPGIAWRDSVLPLQPLKELLNYNRILGRGNVYGSNREDGLVSVIILRSAEAFMALQVDQVLSEQEIVIKQFEAPVSKPIGIAGATILGDGHVMPIADVLELIDLSLGRIQHRSNELWATSATPSKPVITEPVKTEPTVLIVDDSITVRELLSLTFNKAGYRVEQARDGQEAWDKLRDGLPCDLIFCDIEMPKMDGLELLSRLQQDVSLSEIPIAMLTSRGAERHRQMAIKLGASGYFTKPYLEEVLLDGAARMLKGEMLVASSG